MRVLVVGGGPGGLYAAALIRKVLGDDAEVSVCERDPRGATYGWGVVFSEQTLGALQQADRVSYERIEAQFARWDAIDVDFRDVRMRAYGHGFSGLSRKALLGILEDRCLELGVTVSHEHEVTDHSGFADYDLVVAADGLNSRVRQSFADTFRPSYDTRSAKYIWWGTSRRPDVFTYMVRPTEWGIFQGTPYPFTDDRSTFVIECSEQTWTAAGLDRMSEEESQSFCERLFADFLEGHPLLGNRSLWLNFITVRNQRWSAGNVVLLGDAAHTVHFTIGSGTKLAMEDAIALADALHKHRRIPDALAYYENGRAPVIEAFQEAAQESLEWFENLDRSMSLPPEQFMFNFLTRSGRISYDDVRERDAGFADAFDRWFAGAARARADPVLIAPSPLFTPLRLGARTVPNRAVLTIANDLAEGDGVPGAAHERAILHRARGGAGAVMTDVLAVDQRGRVTPRDSGLYSDEQQAGWGAIVAAVHAESDALVMARLGHAGARGATGPRERGIDRPLQSGAWPLIAASARAHTPRAQVPREMDRDDMAAVVEQFRAATERAAGAEFDMLELHAGHGYLLAGFLSPLTNCRSDEYGGSAERRRRFPLEILAAVRSAWPEDRPLAVCLTADDWAGGGGAKTADAVALARELKANGCDLVHLVAGQTLARSRGSYRQHFLSGYGERVRNQAGIPVMIRGRISSADEVNTVIAGGRADLCIVDPPGLAELDARLRWNPPAVVPARAGARTREAVASAA